jgi:hypothetical protein
MRGATGILRGLAAVLVGLWLALGAPQAAATPPDGNGGGTSDGSGTGDGGTSDRGPVSGSFSISPENGPPGTIVDAEVDCGALNESGWTISLRGGNPPVVEDRVTADAGERVGSPALVVPDDTPAGQFPMQAYCQRDGLPETRIGSIDFFVVVEEPTPDPSITAQPTEARAGEPVVILGDWLPACPTNWTARFAGVDQPATVRSFNPIATFAASEPRYAGEFETAVPAAVGPGPGEVDLICGTELAASTAFEVLGPTPNPGPNTGPGPGPNSGSGPALGPGQPPPPDTSPPPPAEPGPLAGLMSWLAALAILALVLRAGLQRSGRQWAARHVQVILRQGSVRR